MEGEWTHWTEDAELPSRRKRRKQQRRFMDDVIEDIQWVGVTEEAGDRVR